MLVLDNESIGGKKGLETSIMVVIAVIVLLVITLSIIALSTRSIGMLAKKSDEVSKAASSKNIGCSAFIYKDDCERAEGCRWVNNVCIGS